MILDAAEDQLQGRWIKYGTDERPCWFSISELQKEPQEVYGRLNGIGVTLLTHKSQQAFKAQLESHASYRPALVASHPAWVGDNIIWVTGDGRVLGAEGKRHPEVIVAFEPNPKFKPKGTVRGWQKSAGRVVPNQDLLLFAIGFGLIGPVLRFVSPHYISPQVELVGDRETGKSTAAIFAASLWGGDPSSDTGGGESWNMTANVIDRLKLAHAYILLVLDEANLAGLTKTEQEVVIQKVVFRLAATGSRKRLSDSATAPNVKLAVLSTSNEPLSEIVKVGPAVLRALETRMMTVLVPERHPHGILNSVPDGFTDSREAIEHLRSTSDLEYGTVGPAFVARLIKAANRDQAKLRQKLEGRATRYEKRIVAVAGKKISKRVLKTLALIAAVLSIAQDWAIIPSEWGSPLGAILRLLRRGKIRGVVPIALSPLKRIREYAGKNRLKLIKVTDLKQPLTASKFAAAAGFLGKQGGATELLVASERLQAEFPDILQMMRKLKKAGRARTERGPQPKLTIKAPKSICGTGRVYCVRISS